MSDFTISISSVVEVAVAISTICGVYIKAQKIAKNKKESKELEKSLILQETKEIASRHKKDLEAKIEVLNQKIVSLEEAVQKDLQHVKETYNNEVRFLGTQVSELKDELRTSLAQVVALISKLLDKH
jgi:TolA-binding protein